MADPKVNILITATDKTKGVFSGVGNALGNLGKVALTAGAVGLAAVGAGLAFSVKEAMEAQEVDAKLAAVLKATGGAAGVTAKMATDYANALTKVTRFSDETIKSAETVLLRFKEIGKETFPQATELALDLATALGTDASSAATMLGKALETPGEGLLRLKAAGVALSDEQINLIQSMADAGNMAGAQKMIMDELTKSVGGMAEAAGSTFAGKLDIFKNALGNIGEAIGMKVLPFIQPFVDKIGRLANVFLDAGLFSEEFTQALADIVGDENAKQIMVIFKNIYDWLQVNLPIAVRTISTFFTTMLLPAIQTVWNWISTTLVPALQSVWSAVQNLASAFRASGPQIKAAIEDIWTSISSSLGENGPQIIANFTGIINSIAELWRQHGDEIIKIVTEYLKIIGVVWIGGTQFLLGLVNGFLKALTGDWQGAWNIIKKSTETFANGIYRLMGTTLEQVRQIWQRNLEMLVAIVILLYQKMFNAGKNIVAGLKAGIQSQWAALVAWLKTQIAALVAMITNALRIHSPSGVFAEIGAQMMAGMAQGIKGGMNMPMSAVGGVTVGTIGAAGGGQGLFIGTQNITIMNGSDVDEIMETIRQANQQSMRTSGSFGYAG